MLDETRSSPFSGMDAIDVIDTMIRHEADIATKMAIDHPIAYRDLRIDHHVGFTIQVMQKVRSQLVVEGIKAHEDLCA